MSDKKLPEGLPTLPEGAVYLGEAKQFKRTIGDDFFGWSTMVGEPKWVYGRHMGTMPHVHYAAPIGSPIAILNGHSPEIKEEGKTPETDAVISMEGDTEIWEARLAEISRTLELQRDHARRERDEWKFVADLLYAAMVYESGEDTTEVIGRWNKAKKAYEALNQKEQP